jgi:hypothetical protein
VAIGLLKEKAEKEHRARPAVPAAFGATYFFAEFGPSTTTFVYPAEIVPAALGVSVSRGIRPPRLTRARAAFRRRRQ